MCQYSIINYLREILNPSYYNVISWKKFLRLKKVITYESDFHSSGKFWTFKEICWIRPCLREGNIGSTNLNTVVHAGYIYGT